jgi:UMF1 family MFS transporter
VDFGILGTIFVSIGFLGSIVFIISILPEIAHPEQHDSAKGFMFGYWFSVSLAGFNLTMVMMPEWWNYRQFCLLEFHFYPSVSGGLQ